MYYICQEKEHVTHQFGSRDGGTGNVAQRIYCVFCGKDKGAQGNSVGLAHLNNVGGLSAILRSLDVCYLALGCFRGG